MNFLKYNLFGPNHHSLNTIADHLLNGSIADFVGSDFINSQPSVNVIETETDFRIELAAPGLEKEDFQLNIEKDQLKISVENSFERSFNLSDKVDKNKISAIYENGILNILVPKREVEIIKKRSINIS